MSTIIYTDPACTTVFSTVTTTTTCSGGQQLIACTSQPFGFGTTEAIVADT
jgi:hypothetical protein